MQKQMSHATQAVTVVSKEQAFFAGRVEEMMRAKGVPTQGTVERSEDNAEMFQRLKGEYEIIRGKEAGTDEREVVPSLFSKEAISKTWFDNLRRGPDFETILKRNPEVKGQLCYCREARYGQGMEQATMEPVASPGHMDPKGGEVEVEECHLCYENIRGVDREIRANVSRDVMKGNGADRGRSAILCADVHGPGDTDIPDICTS